MPTWCSPMRAETHGWCVDTTPTYTHTDTHIHTHTYLHTHTHTLVGCATMKPCPPTAWTAMLSAKWCAWSVAHVSPSALTARTVPPKWPATTATYVIFLTTRRAWTYTTARSATCAGAGMGGVWVACMLMCVRLCVCLCACVCVLL